MSDTEPVCTYWTPSECEGSTHCPVRCPRFVDREGLPWVVRPAEADDRTALVDMYDDFASTERAQGVPPRKRFRVESWVDDLLADGCNIVAARDGRIAGHALYTSTDDPEPEFAVFVHQDFQNRGIGTEVSKHVIATAALADRDALTLVVEPSNRDARRLYDVLGFENVDRSSDTDRDCYTGYLRMRLSLSKESAIEYARPPLGRSDHLGK